MTRPDDDRVQAFQRGWASVPAGEPGDRTRAGIAALDAHDAHYRPSVCAICLHGFDVPDLHHRSWGDENGVICQWPCNHEVRTDEFRCLSCRPITQAEAEQDPFMSPALDDAEAGR